MKRPKRRSPAKPTRIKSGPKPAAAPAITAKQPSPPVEPVPAAAPPLAPEDDPDPFATGLAHQQAGRLAEAERYFQVVPKSDPTYADSRYRIGLIASQTGRPGMAVEMFGEAVALYTDFFPYFLNYAKALLVQGRQDEAAALLTTALDRFPTEFGPVRDLAQLAEQRQDWAEADRFWSLARERFPQIWPPYAGRARALHGLGRSEDAEQILLSALAAFPGQAGPINELAQLAEQRGIWDDVRRWSTMLREQFPNAWPGYAASARALRALGRQEEAEQLLLSAVAALPDQLSPIHELARLAEQRQDWADVLHWYTVARDRFPASWSGYRGSVQALREMGQPDAARQILLDAVERLPRETGPLYALAALAEQQADWAGSLHWWALALRRFPLDEDIRRRQAAALARSA